MNPQPLVMNHAAKVEVSPGHPLPLGVTVRRGGVNFAIASPYGSSVTLLVFILGEQEAILASITPIAWIGSPIRNRTCTASICLTSQASTGGVSLTLRKLLHRILRSQAQKLY